MKSIRKFDSDIQKKRKPMKDPQTFKKLITDAQMALFQGDVTTALKLLDEVIQIEPLRGIPWTLKATAHGLEGRLSEALKAIEKAIEIDPSDPDKWELKSTLLQRIGRKQEALECLKKVKELKIS